MTSDPLFQPIRYGAIDAPNRIVMAPLTRTRANGCRATIRMRKRGNQDENPVWGERRRA